MVWNRDLFRSRTNIDSDIIVGHGYFRPIETQVDDGRLNISVNSDVKTVTELNEVKTINAKKQAIITSPSDEIVPEGIFDVYEKDQNTKDLIKLAINKNDFLNNLMDVKRLEAVTMAMYTQEYEQDRYIITEGETGDHLYISETGIYDVVKNGIVISSFGAGVAFGELGILYRARRFASIRARTTTKVWILQRSAFSRIMIKLGRLEREENMNFLKSVAALTSLSEEKRGQVADLLKRTFFTTGAEIIKQGDEGDLFYIIRAGTVRVEIHDNDGTKRVVNTLKRGDCFGEQALIHREKRLATVIAEPPGTECLYLDRTAFELYLGTLNQIKAVPIVAVDHASVTPQMAFKTKYSHIKLSDLQIIKTLGVGSFGRVKLVEHKETKEFFALKYLKKYEIVKLKLMKDVYNEKDVMTSCDSPFIVRLCNTYRDAKYVYFLMEACLGGDLWTVLHKNKCFDEKTTKFVIACVIEGLGYLHSRNMIYRDLKPENLMIDWNGYIKIIDFGFAKRLQPPQKTNSFVGTPEYIAPEILNMMGHDRAIDYWAIGVLIHELLIGKALFHGKDNAQTYNIIRRGINSVAIPIKIPILARDLILKLCRQNPTKRLGYAKNGIIDIKDHLWFKGFKWVKLGAQTMKAPRKLRHPKASFDKYPKDDENPPDETSGWDKYF